MSLKHRFKLIQVKALRVFGLAFPALLLIGDSVSHAQFAPSYDVTITADNAYRIGFGDENSVIQFEPTVINTTAGEIYGGGGPEGPISVNSNNFSYLYIAAWADDATAQGVRASFKVAGIPQFAAGAWEVYATGDTASAAAAALGETSINNEIANANLPSPPGDSQGWVDGNCNLTADGIGCVIVDIVDVVPDLLDKNAVGSLASLEALHFGVDGSGWLWYDNDTPSNTNPFAYTAGGDAGWLIFRAKIPLANPLCTDQATTALWNTGVDANGNVLAVGTQDPNYVLESSPMGSPGDPTFNGGFHPNWLPNDTVGGPSSAWITDSSLLGGDAGPYQYRLTVNVPSNLTPLPPLYGRWLSDNAITDLRVNGVSTGLTRGAAEFNNWDVFAIPSSFLDQPTNDIDFFVNNDGGPVGLRVEWCQAPSSLLTAVPALNLYGMWILCAAIVSLGAFLTLSRKAGKRARQ